MKADNTSINRQSQSGFRRAGLPYEYYSQKAHQLRSDHVSESLAALGQLVRRLLSAPERFDDRDLETYRKHTT